MTRTPTDRAADGSTGVRRAQAPRPALAPKQGQPGGALAPATGADALPPASAPGRAPATRTPAGGVGASPASSAGLQAAAAKMSEAPTLFDAMPDHTVMRQCRACGESKPLATAYRKRRGGHYRKECRTCQYAREKEWREAQGPQYRRATTQWELYRLPWDDYIEMLEEQGGVCALCRNPFADDPRLTHTDHKHGCEHPGKGRKSCRECVRGILCHRCNIFVGWIETDYRRMADLFNYLGVDGVVMWAYIMRDIGYELLKAGEEEYARREGGADA